MRALILVFVGGLALLLGPSLSLSQNTKQGGGKSKGGKSKGGGFGGPGGMPSFGPASMKKGKGGPGMTPGMFPATTSRMPGQRGEAMVSPTVLAAPSSLKSGGRGGRDGDTDGLRGERGGGNADALALSWFRRADQDGDGALSYDELDEGLRGERDYWDVNRDGFIDLGEFRDYAQARREQWESERTANGDPSRSGRGGDRDTGRSPFAAPTAPGGMSLSSRGEQPARPVVYAPGNLPRELPSWFTERDRDRDGQISLYEWRVSGAPLDEFRRYDHNNDGLTTAEELLRAVTADGGRAGPGRDGANGGASSRLFAAAGGGSPGGRPSMQGNAPGSGGRFGAPPSGRGGPGSGGPGRTPPGGGGAWSARGGRPPGGGSR